VSGFSNAVVGGIGSLVRKWIKSPNYIPATTGWTINQDGSVEFNNGTFRGTITASNIILIGASGEILVYSGPPANGNLVLAISAQAGNDAFGNSYGAGLSFGAGVFPNAFSLATFISKLWGSPFIDYTENALQGILDIAGPAGAVSVQMKHQAFGIDSLALFGPLIGLTGNTVFNSGPQGKYYAEQVNIGAQVITTGVVTNITAMSAPSNSYTDYGSMFSATQWVCPVDGFYKINYVVVLNATVTGRYLLNITNQSTGEILGQLDYPASGNSGESLCAYKFIPAGSVVVFKILQASGASRTISGGTVSIGRDL
jgi:hypothetical protein